MVHGTPWAPPQVCLQFLGVHLAATQAAATGLLLGDPCRRLGTRMMGQLIYEDVQLFIDQVEHGIGYHLCCTLIEMLFVCFHKWVGNHLSCTLINTNIWWSFVNMPIWLVLYQKYCFETSSVGLSKLTWIEKQRLATLSMWCYGLINLEAIQSTSRWTVNRTHLAASLQPTINW